MVRRPLAVAVAAMLILALHARSEARAAVVPALPRLHAVADPVHGGRIVDRRGRQVILRGVNLNSLGEYWQQTPFSPVIPLQPGDPLVMQTLGFNAVRLVLSWSRVEPQRGVYDDNYLALADSVITRLAAAGIYTIVDMHQDAWGATLAGRPNEVCPAGWRSALGWDGAPAWATLVPDDVPRCTNGIREQSPAVIAAWQAFFANQQGIEDAYSAMWEHVAEHFASAASVAGFDIMNEPNAYEAQGPDLARMYGNATGAIRAGERAAHGFPHLILYEPSVISSGGGFRGVPNKFSTDPNLVYSPHLYPGAFNFGPVTESSFTTARDDAIHLGGDPVVIGEWGTDAVRATRPYDYFLVHQAYQDRYLMSALMWQWRQSCGDPHKSPGLAAGAASVVVKGLWNIDCATNVVGSPRLKLLADLQRGYVRAVAGRLTGMVWDPKGRRLGATGVATKSDPPLLAFYPLAARVRTRGLTHVRILPGPQGTSYVEARPRGGAWRLLVDAAPPTSGARTTSLNQRQQAVLKSATHLAAVARRRH